MKISIAVYLVAVSLMAGCTTPSGGGSTAHRKPPPFDPVAAGPYTEEDQAFNDDYQATMRRYEAERRAEADREAQVEAAARQAEADRAFANKLLETRENL